MLLMDIADFCKESSKIWQLVGYVVLVFRIAIPLLLIIFGMVDLGRAVISSDEKQINKSITTLVRRFAAAIIIFFIPTIVNALFSLIGLMSSEEEDIYKACYECVTNATGETCKGYVSNYSSISANSDNNN